LPWFWTIVAGSAFWRFVCVPFALIAVRTSGRLRPIQGKVLKVQERITEARAKQDIVAMQRAGLEMKKLYAEANVNPVTGMLLPNFAQLPITIGLFFAVKRICTHPVEQLKDGGVGSWFWANDLTVMDPYYILPAIFAAMVNLQIAVGGRDIDTSGSPMSGHIMNVFRVLSLLGAFFMSSFPAGLFVGLITTTSLTAAQSLVLRSDSVRKMLNIPVVPVSQQGRIPSMMESIKFAREKWLEVQKDAQSVKRR
jgi:YidC/Oxa1 family membrane protein insertase